MFAACLDHGNLMNKKLPSDILNHIFTLMSASFAEQDAWNPIYLISFGGSGSNVMPSPKDSGCSGWNDPVGKIGTWHIKKKKKICPTVTTWMRRCLVCLPLKRFTC